MFQLPMSIHYHAMAHLDRAKALMASGDRDHLRYAALELRYSIEHLFYALIPQYKTELPDDVLQGDVWRPADIIDMISDIDPHVTQDREFRMGVQPAAGVPPKEMIVMGRQSGIGKDIIRKVYHKLGFYLHARTDQKAHDPEHLRKRLEKYLPFVERYRSDSMLGGGVAVKANFKCQACGRPIVHREERAKRNPYITCPNKQCGAIFKYLETDDPEQSMHKLLQHDLKCENCGDINWLDIHKLQEMAETRGLVNCHTCNTKYQVQPWIVFQRLDENGEPVKKMVEGNEIQAPSGETTAAENADA